MTGIEIALLLIGCVFMVGSFFVSEKLSGAEINRIAELSDNELKRITGKGMENAESQIDAVVDDKVEEVAEKVEIALERESNMKIMAIGEYSDTVIDGMKRTHDEIMFLYSMLNDKHTELTSLTGDLQRLAANIKNMQEGMPVSSETTKYAQPVTATGNSVFYENEAFVKAEAYEEETPSAEEEEMEFYGTAENHNDMILTLHKEGLSKVEIAKKLNLGVGEVSLVIGLYKGEEE